MAKRFYDFNIILTLKLIIINFKKKLPKNLLVSFIFITLSYVNIKQIDYEKVNCNLQTFE
jgi:hypothetical protein